MELIFDDCLNAMKNIPDKSIDLILCDLPYGTTACKWDSVIPFEPLWEQYERVIKQHGIIALNAAQPFTSALVMSNPKWFRYDLIWEKDKATGYLNARRMPMRAHESIVIFYEKLPIYNPQMEEGKPYKSNHKPGDSGDCYGEVKHYSWTNEGTRFPRSVLQFPVDMKPIHPTQKPVSLLEYLIKTYSNEGDLVLDNCMGSGSTGVACLNTNRNFIGIEKEEKYFKLASERIRKYQELK